MLNWFGISVIGSTAELSQCQCDCKTIAMVNNDLTCIPNRHYNRILAEIIYLEEYKNDIMGV